MGLLIGGIFGLGLWLAVLKKGAKFWSFGLGLMMFSSGTTASIGGNAGSIAVGIVMGFVGIVCGGVIDFIIRLKDVGHKSEKPNETNSVAAMPRPETKNVHVSRDKIIGLICSVTDEMLKDINSDEFLRGAILITDGFKGAGWSSDKNAYRSAEFVVDLSAIDGEAKDWLAIASLSNGLARTYAVDRFVEKLHRFLHSNYKTYRSFAFSDPQLGDISDVVPHKHVAQEPTKASLNTRAPDHRKFDVANKQLPYSIRTMDERYILEVDGYTYIYDRMDDAIAHVKKHNCGPEKPISAFGESNKTINKIASERKEPLASNSELLDYAIREVNGRFILEIGGTIFLYDREEEAIAHAREHGRKTTLNINSHAASLVKPNRTDASVTRDTSDNDPSIFYMFMAALFVLAIGAIALDQ